MIITVANSKGGVGKTTTSIILAEIAALQNHLKTLVVDMDTQRNAYKMLMTEDGEGRYKPVFNNLEVLISDAAAPDPAKLADYDLVVVDTPPRADAAIIRQVFGMTDVFVSPFQLGENEITGIGELFELLPDKDLFVYPLHVVSPMESSEDKKLQEDAFEFFSQYGLSRNDILEWPMRKTVKNNISRKKPFYFALIGKDKAVFRRAFDVIMKNWRNEQNA